MLGRRADGVAVSTRLKSVTSIQKITKSMKMVSAAKFSRAEKSLKEARANGPATLGAFPPLLAHTACSHKSLGSFLAPALSEKGKVPVDEQTDKQVKSLSSVAPLPGFLLGPSSKR